MSVAPPDTGLPDAPRRDPAPEPDTGHDRDGGGAGGNGGSASPPSAAATPAPVAPVDPWQRIADLIGGVGAGPSQPSTGEPVLSTTATGPNWAAILLLVAAAGGGYWWYSKRGKGE